MKRVVRVLMTGFLAIASLPCLAEVACPLVKAQARIEAEKGELTLADLLAHGSCPQLRQAAAQVSLGEAPHPGSLRVFDGSEVRRWLTGLGADSAGLGNTVELRIPGRIVVERAGATKSCEEIARFLARAASRQVAISSSESWQEDLHCAAARAIPKDGPLELTKAAWNASSRRWEFALRCARPEDCVPFLVWARGDKAPPALVATAPKALDVAVKCLVKPGQTATLRWDEAGIRIVLPVTCLDAGGQGQFVRVRFKTGAAILRAEVLGDGTLRAAL